MRQATVPSASIANVSSSAWTTTCRSREGREDRQDGRRRTVAPQPRPRPRLEPEGGSRTSARAARRYPRSCAVGSSLIVEASRTDHASPGRRRAARPGTSIRGVGHLRRRRSTRLPPASRARRPPAPARSRPSASGRAGRPDTRSWRRGVPQPSTRPAGRLLGDRGDVCVGEHPQDRGRDGKDGGRQARRGPHGLVPRQGGIHITRVLRSWPNGGSRRS